jgi:uncharacterized ion transporter superfamily protein YfcC
MFKFPHTLSIITVIIIIMAILTYILPAGKFERKYDETLERELVVPNTYKVVEQNPQGYTAVLTSFLKGIMQASEIIGYVLIVGGVYGVVLRTNALNNGLMVLIKKLGRKTQILIPILMFLFAVGGTATGMWEETLAFYAIICTLMIVAGFDSLTGVAILVLGAGTGVLASTINPFATGIASSIAEISIKDGMNYRILAWGVMVFTSVVYVMRYAMAVKKDPTKSLLTLEQQAEHKQHFLSNTNNNSNNIIFSLKDKLVVIGFAVNIVVMIFGVISLDWGILELCMSFLTLAIFTAIVFKINQHTFWDHFINGSKDLLAAALVVGFARAIMVVANDGFIVDTILNAIATALQGINKEFFIVINLVVQTCIGFFVPSSSGHAALTMSIMAPLADIFTIPRHSVVTAMQFASGLANLITPTAGVLMAAIGIGRVGYSTWLKFALPLFAILFIISIIITTMSVFLG